MAECARRELIYRNFLRLWAHGSVKTDPYSTKLSRKK